MEKHAFSCIYGYSFVRNNFFFFNGHTLLCSIGQKNSREDIITTSIWQMPYSFSKWIWELNSIRYILRLPSVPRSVTSLHIFIFTTKLINTRTHFWWNCVILKDTTKLCCNFCFSTLACISTLESTKNRLEFFSEEFSISFTGFLYHSKITDIILQPCIKPLLSSAKTPDLLQHLKIHPFSCPWAYFFFSSQSEIPQKCNK